MQNEVGTIFLFHGIDGIVEVAPSALLVNAFSGFYSTYEFSIFSTIYRYISLSGYGYEYPKIRN